MKALSLEFSLLHTHLLTLVTHTWPDPPRSNSWSKQVTVEKCCFTGRKSEIHFIPVLSHLNQCINFSIFLLHQFPRSGLINVRFGENFLTWRVNLFYKMAAFNVSNFKIWITFHTFIIITLSLTLQYILTVLLWLYCWNFVDFM